RLRVSAVSASRASSRAISSSRLSFCRRRKEPLSATARTGQETRHSIGGIWLECSPFAKLRTRSVKDDGVSRRCLSHDHVRETIMRRRGLAILSREYRGFLFLAVTVIGIGLYMSNYFGVPGASIGGCRIKGNVSRS